MACRLLREFVGADAGALFWMDENGLPEGFFHEDSPVGARDLFVNEFERLFMGPDELNVAILARLKGSGAGHLLTPPASYLRSNTFNLLVRPSGHRHALDLRIDHEGRPRVIVLLFRSGTDPFEETDLATLKLAAGPLRRSLSGNPQDAQWEATLLEGHALIDASGTSLLMMSEGARRILQTTNSVGQDIQLEGPITTPPRFMRHLCSDIAAGRATRGCVPIPDGRLVITPERLNTPVGDQSAILMTMQIERPRNLRWVERLLELALSPRQRGIMLEAAFGHDRTEVAARTGTSAEAMKKHLGAIYQETGSHSWEEMARLLDR
jgi:DNA-binding CsgD family transcriptional regulator